MDIKIKAIVLKATKSGDKDFLVTLFSLEKGVIKAKLKSASTPKAKLKFAKEQFTFADFILVEKNGFYTITNADLLDSFYSISQNYDKFLEANQIFKVILKILPQAEPNPSLFVNVLKFLSLYAYENVQKNLILTKFYLELFFSEGYDMNVSSCNSCKTKLGMEVYFDFDNGEITCFSCKSPYSQKISFQTVKTLKLVVQTDLDKLSSVSLEENNLENALKVLEMNFEKRF